MVLAGFAGGVIFAAKWISGDKVQVTVKRQRIKGNENTMNGIGELDVKQSRDKKTRQEKKADRKARHSRRKRSK